MRDLTTMTSKELKELAKELKVKDWWLKNKAQLIEDITAIQNASDEEAAAREAEIAEEDKLFEHYQKNWKKYGPKNDWTKFLKDYKAGKITLVEEPIEAPVEEVEETTETEAPSEAHNEPISEVSEEPKQNAKVKVKKTNLKLSELTYKGQTKSIKEWAAELEMPWPTLYDRVNRNGWTVEDAIETPLGQRRAK